MELESTPLSGVNIDNPDEVNSPGSIAQVCPDGELWLEMWILKFLAMDCIARDWRVRRG